jgi:Uma2 family endonuclease
VALLVEVADHSLYEDRKMLAVYARAGIPRIWIVSLDQASIEIYWSPHGDADGACYRETRTVGAAEDLAISDRGQDLGVIPAAAIFE